MAITIVLVIVGYSVWGPQIDRLLKGNVLLGQVTQLVQLDQDYLLNNLPDALAPLAAEEVSSEENLQQRFIETLFIHANEFDTASVDEAKEFLYEYYGFPAPVPTSVQEVIAEATQKFFTSYPLFAANGSTDTPSTTTGTDTSTATSSGSFDKQAFVDQLITILANHQVSTNNYQSVKRSQTIQSVMELFAEQL